MNWWRKLIHILCSKAVADAYLEGLQHSNVLWKAQALQDRNAAYIQGHAEGVKLALDTVCEEARKRFEETREGEGVTLADVARARRGLLH